MKKNRRVELFTVLGLVTLYVGAAHVAASEKVANALLAAGDHVPIALLVFMVALVVLRVAVVLVIPGMVAARLGLLLLAWYEGVRAEKVPTRAAPSSPAG